jgi:CubicO group peptidase (beta-lactamase class C family)
MLHYCWSATKSITSALIGIAIDQGKINSLNEQLLSFFPEYDDIANIDGRKESITFENVLTMSAGFDWDVETSTLKMIQSRDWIKYVLDLPMSDVPGTKYVYNNGGSHLLSGIITNQTGQSAEEFAEENLFSKIGVTKWEWKTDPNGLTNTDGMYGGLYLHPVNMAMFGYLCLKNGVLNGEQVISEDWVKISTSKHIERNDPNNGEFIGYYGYQWLFFKDGNTYFAAGKAGQFIFVMPGLNMVVVMTAENFEDVVPGFDILNNIVDALVTKS